MISKRTLLKYGGATGAGLLLPHAYTQGRAQLAEVRDGRVFGYVPFTQPLPIPERCTPLQGAQRLDPKPGYYPRDAGPGWWPCGTRGMYPDVAHGIAPEFGRVPEWNFYKTGFSANRTHEQEFGLVIEETTQRYVPYGPDTPVFTYRDVTKPKGSGRTPGPTMYAEYLAPVVVRNYNGLTRYGNSLHHDIETSMHLHGSHSPAHSDGFPDFYTLAGEARDYYHPNIAPKRTESNNYAPVFGGEFDEAWIPTTMWYHDHGMDLTGFTVSRGLAGFYLVNDPRQRRLAEQGVIPAIDATDGYGNPLDLALALTDQLFNSDGSLHYDFLDHDGRLGNVFTVNGAVQPKHRVERRKYRFRILNASNARVYELRLSTQRKMAIIGTDTWLLPNAIEVQSFQLTQGQRHDLIIDFRGAPDEVFLENILVQREGRKPEGIDASRRIPLLKFEVHGPDHHWETPVVDGTPIRGTRNVDPQGQFEKHRTDEVVATRRFRFERGNGGWLINGRFFSSRRADAIPELGYGTERWIFENGGGGWWHPIHTHLEGHQVQRVNGRLPRRERRFNSDLTALEGNTVAEVLIKSRTFSGPFAFHCHTIEHEDMRMMAIIDPTPGSHGRAGDALDSQPPLDGRARIFPSVSGVLADCDALNAEHRIFYEQLANTHPLLTEPLRDRGVGFPHCNFISRR